MTSHSFARAPSTACLLVTLLFGSGLAGAADIEVPRALDERLKVELFAAEPDVATVTGLTVDALGRVYVVESHTHFRPENYTGPETDRIRLLEDTNGDGRADRILTFFSGTTYTMNVAAHPNGWIYVATRNQVFRLRDNNDDGVADERQDLISVETEADFPHNGLSGFAFDFAGDVYFGLGENSGLDAKLTGRASGSPTGDIYFALGQNSGVDARVVGSQGQSISVARGAGGIFRCQPDGSGLELVATGFWNPFHLCFDTYGRMFTGDNDPGNRPPCRFLSIVEGGNYGYVRRTLEPFIAVDGETPGSLPMTSSTGESPTGILAYEAGLFPADYLGRIFVASWGEHRIDSYQLEPSGAGFTAKTEAIAASAGQRVFFHPRGPGCARCHRIDGRGNAIGPSFVRMNGRLPLQRRQLVQAIVDPSQDIDPGYLPLTILTVDGQVASGIYYKHGNGIREIFDLRGKTLKFKIDDIEQMSVSKLSIMPDGLGSNMTLQEMRDVLAYLLEPPE